MVVRWLLIVLRLWMCESSLLLFKCRAGTRDGAGLQSRPVVPHHPEATSNERRRGAKCPSCHREAPRAMYAGCSRKAGDLGTVQGGRVSLVT